jgi:undecaprenyl-diphosphatase
MPHLPDLPEPDQHPPLLPTWRAWYALVLAALAAEIGLFIWLSRYFAA